MKNIDKLRKLQKQYIKELDIENLSKTNEKIHKLNTKENKKRVNKLQKQIDKQKENLIFNFMNSISNILR